METFAQRLADPDKIGLAPVFTGWVREMARINGLTEDQVWQTWAEYTKECERRDQSPLTWECANWNGWRGIKS